MDVCVISAVLWMVRWPWLRIRTGRSSDRHPLAHFSHIPKQSIDFWGPFGVMNVYMAILWFGHVKDAPWA